MLTQSQSQDTQRSYACCGARPLRRKRGSCLLQRVELSRRIHTMKVEECEEPHVNGTYRRVHEASCREHFVNEDDMHLYYVPVRQEWHIGSRHVGNGYTNLVIQNQDHERFHLFGRHRWFRSDDREEDEGEGQGEAEADDEDPVEAEGDQNSSMRSGELVIKVMSNPEYRCT